MVTKVMWGEKRICPACSAKFYDLGKNPAICPKCKHVYDPTLQIKTKRGRSLKKAADMSDIAGKARMAEKKKKALAKASVEGAELPDFEEVEVEGVEEIEEIEEDLEEIAEIEDIDEPAGEDESDEEALIEDLEVEDKSIVDKLEDSEEEEEEKPAKAKKKKR